jgi:hypothetical protein
MCSHSTQPRAVRDLEQTESRSTITITAPIKILFAILLPPLDVFLRSGYKGIFGSVSSIMPRSNLLEYRTDQKCQYCLRTEMKVALVGEDETLGRHIIIPSCNHTSPRSLRPHIMNYIDRIWDAATYA